MDGQFLRIAHGHGERGAVELDRHDLIHDGHRLGNEVEDLASDIDIGDTDDLHRQLFGECLGQLFVADQPHLHADLADQVGPDAAPAPRPTSPAVRR